METVVLILAYNESETIVKAIESVAAQGRDVKIVFVDDGSTDGTGELAKKTLRRLMIGHVFVKKFANTGVVANARRAFSLVSDDDCFIMRLDGDDELLPNAINNLKDAYEEGTFVVGSYLETSKTKQTVRKPATIHECIACGVLMRIKDVVEVGGLANLNVGVFIEYDLFARLLAGDPTKDDSGLRMKTTDEPVYLYNRHEGSMTTNKGLVDDSLSKLGAVWGSDFASKIRKY